MCDNCGVDHPTIDEFGVELVHLDRAYDQYKARVGEFLESGAKGTVNPYAVEKWVQNTISSNLDPMMTEMMNEGFSVRSATAQFVTEMMNTAFSVAMQVHAHFASAFPAESTPAPTQDEVEEFINRVKENQTRREQVAKILSEDGEVDLEMVRELLSEAGFEVPDGAEVSLATTPDGEKGIQITPPGHTHEKKKEEPRDEYPGMYL